MSTLNVDKVDPSTGTDLELGTSGDTVTVPTGVTLTLTNSTLSLPTTINTDKLDPKSGTALELGTSGDTVTVPSGVGLTLTDSTLLLPTTITSTTEVKTNKVSPATGVAFALGDSGDTFTVPSGATIVNSGTATGFGITSASFRPNVNPLIINGDTKVAQRSAAATGITADGYYATDRFYVRATNGGTWTMYLNAGAGGDAAADGFPTSLWMDNTTADASLGAGDYLRVEQRIEAQDCQVLKYGGANAEILTLGFWVYCTKTGIYIVELYQPDDDRSCSQSYTIDVTDTWEYKVLNFPADTTGVIDDNNGNGLTVTFWMAAGTDYTSGTLNETWNSTVAANRAVGQVNAADSTSNNFQLTGIQLEVGDYTSSTIPPFQHESYGDNLARCQRYYFDTNPGRNGTAALAGGAYTTATNIQGAIQFPVEMRANPTMYTIGGTFYWAAEKYTYNKFDDITIYNSSLNRSGFNGSGGVSATGNDACLVRFRSSSARCAFVAEL